MRRIVWSVLLAASLLLTAFIIFLVVVYVPEKWRQGLRVIGILLAAAGLCGYKLWQSLQPATPAPSDDLDVEEVASFAPEPDPQVEAEITPDLEEPLAEVVEQAVDPIVTPERQEQ